MQRIPWGRVVAMALLGATATVAGLAADASASGRGVLELIDPGADGPAAGLIAHDFPGVQLDSGFGHDGQQYYAIARAPMHLDDAAPHLDRPGYRAGRPLLPWLGWLLHPQGGGTGLVLALVMWSALALALGGIVTGGLAAALGAGPRAAGYMALLFPLAPGSFASFGLTTPDALATSLALTAILLCLRGHARAAVGAGVLAVLAKESVLLILVGWAISRRRRADWLPAAAAAAAAATWALALRLVLRDSGEALRELRPLVHVPKLVGGWLDGEDAFAAVLVLGVVALAAATLVRRGLASPLGWIVVLQLAMLPMFHRDVLQLSWNASRATLPLLVVSAIALSSRATPPDQIAPRDESVTETDAPISAA